MIVFEGLKENLRFIILETLGQIESTLAYIEAPDPETFQKIVDQDNYVDNLKSTIEDLCYQRMGSASEVAVSKAERDVIRAIHIIAINLERIADNCINILRQLEHLSRIPFLYRFKYKHLFQLLIKGVSKIPEVLESRNLNDALDICKIEDETDTYYKQNLDRILKQLENGGHTRNLVTVLFIYRYLERMGDSLLNIGEALIIGIVGEKIRISQIESLASHLEHSGTNNSLSGLTFRSYRGTRSGCRISKVNLEDTEEDSDYRNCILKEGSIEKIKAERESLNTWNQLFPGIAPRVFTFHEKESTASMLMEFIDAITLDEIILNSEIGYFKYVFETFLRDCETVWMATKKDAPVRVDYTGQIKRRLPVIRDVHPDFVRFEKSMGDSEIASSDALIGVCERIEREIIVPFSVRIHGDFNVSNIMFSQEDGRIKFIDLHRSGDADYLQDASVFLMSNFRLPVFANNLRERLNWVIENFFDFVKSFAKRENDDTFDFRMTLALSRSMYTSTRFELNYKLAKEMFLRAHYLMDKMTRHITANKDIRSFKVPDSVLYF